MNRKVIIYKSDLLPISETFIEQQATHLKKWSYTLIGVKTLQNSLNLDSLNFLTLDKENKFTIRLRRKIFSHLGIIRKADLKAFEAQQASLVHVHFGTEAVKIWPTIKKIGLPMIVTLHGQDINTNPSWWHAGKGGLLMRAYPEKLRSLAKQENVAFIAVSDAIKKRAIEYGIAPQKIVVSYIGVDTDTFRPALQKISERHEVLYVGRLVEKKGCEYVIKAFAGIQKEFPTAKLVVVGDGPLRQNLEQLAFALNVNIEFTGALSSTQIRERFSSARIFCLPSITANNGDAEGFGIVILEAQSSGVPVITSARGGATEGIEHNVTGFSHAEKDIKAIEKYLRMLLADDQKANSFSTHARARCVENFSINECTKKLEEIYDQYAYRKN